MIIISLDEFGDFEGIKNEQNIEMGIAGILYDDKDDSEDLINERERIKKFYEKCISLVETKVGINAELVYPDALHSDGSDERDSNIVKPVKRAVNGNIGEFLKNGTFKGQELLSDNQLRKGEYYIFSYVKSERGVLDLLGDNANFLANDNKGSNLYFHMASEIVTRVLFHNPMISTIHEVSMDIATRSSNEMDASGNRAGEYYKQSYRPKRSERGNKVRFAITNGDIYRSVISQDMIRYGKSHLKIKDFKVTPIRYVSNADGMEFLYLSDSICTFISHKKVRTDSATLERINKKLNCINDKSRNIVFGYDEIDIMYRNAWECYERGDYYDALKVCYEAGLKEGGYSEYYKKWFEHIKGCIIADTDEVYFTRAVRYLYDTLKTNTLDQERSVYILEVLEKMSVGVEKELDDAESRAIMYKLYDAGVSIYCHIGDSNKAISYYNKCRRFASRIGVEEYLGTLNKMSELLLDNFEWKRAKKIAEESVKYNQELLKMKNAMSIYDKADNNYLGLSKAYSQLGQVYSFMRNPLAEKYFKKAFEGFALDSADYRITQSYLLHYYLDMGMEDEYRKESKEYFGGNDSPSKQFEYILKEGFKDTPIFNYKYALYVFIRGVYCYGLDNISDSLKAKLYNIDNTLSKAQIKAVGKKKADFTRLTGHPTEIIFKYLALIAAQKGDKEESDVFEKKARTSLGYTGNTIDLIITYGNAQITKFKNKKRLFTKYEEVFNILTGRFDVLKNIPKPQNVNDMEILLDSYITYMYH